MTEALDADAQSLVGTVLAGRYRIERLLGSGGMGSVYRAEHVLMRKACAVKVLHREMTQVKEVVARFEREAVAAARIEHPHVAGATDFGRLDDGSFYLVLEFIEGQSLGQLIAAGPLPEERALIITRQIADALSAAHAAGIVHRDLKPDNVMLVAKDSASDFVKVLDFGIAKVKIEEPGPDHQALTRLNTVMGTPEYMAPEQARGEAVDHRADLYTLGVILYEMLSGTSPFRHEELVVVLTKKLTEEPPPLPEQVSSRARELVASLLKRAPAERLQSAAELLGQIDAILGYSPAPSLAFAPVSGQAAPIRKKEPVQSVAYASTVVGEPPVLVPEVDSRARFRALLAPAVTLAQRRVALGSRQIALGWLGALLILSPLVLALLFSTLSSGSSEPLSPLESARTPAIDEDLDALLARAESGDREGLRELSEKAPRLRSARVYLALGRGYFKVGQLDAGLRAYRSGGEVDAKAFASPDVLRDLRRALSDQAQVSLTLQAAAALGSSGADFLYDVYDGSRATNAPLSKQAKVVLDSDAVSAQHSEALKVALDLAKAKAEGCPAVKKLLPRVIASADARSVPVLARLAERRGCGFLGLRDCFACLRAGKDFANAQKAAAGRPGPPLDG